MRAALLSTFALAVVACTSSVPTPEAAPVPAAPAGADQAAAAPPPKVLLEPTEPRYAATHVLIAWAGAVGAPASVTRDRESAMVVAQKIREEALSGTPLDGLARTHSTSPSAPRGGGVGVYATGTMMPAFERGIASVEVGQIAPLIETPYGFHIARRDAVVEAHLAHIQVAWTQSWRATTDRTRDQAMARAIAARAELASGKALSAVAAMYSDDPSATANGGDLGLVAPGQLVPAFEAAAFELEPGQISEVVETRYGFHIIVRLP